jgi:hypothetical protein
MANFGAVPLNVQSPGTYPGYNTAKLNLHYTVTYSGGDYFHYKTNIVKGGGWMGMIEFVGHNFGSGGLPIRSAMCFYAYSATQTLINVGLSNAYPGMIAQTVYQSSDNYAVLVVSTSYYYSGWVLNAYQVNPTTPGYDLQILAVAQTSSTAAAF